MPDRLSVCDFSCSSARSVKLNGCTILSKALFEFVELADLAAGVAQKVAQDLVFLAHARADIGKILDVDVIAAAIARAGLGCAADSAPGSPPLRPNRSVNLAMTNASNPVTPLHNGHAYSIKILYTLADGNTRKPPPRAARL